MSRPSAAHTILPPRDLPDTTEQWEEILTLAIADPHRTSGFLDDAETTPPPCRDDPSGCRGGRAGGLSGTGDSGASPRLGAHEQNTARAYPSPGCGGLLPGRCGRRREPVLAAASRRTGLRGSGAALGGDRQRRQGSSIARTAAAQPRRKEARF